MADEDMVLYVFSHVLWWNIYKAQSTGAVEYTDSISAEGYNFPSECPGYDTKKSDGEAPVLELWGMWSTLSFSLLSGPFWLRVVAPDKLLSMGQIELCDI